MIYIVNHILKTNAWTKQKLKPHLHKTIALNLGENLPNLLLKVEQDNNNFYILKNDKNLCETDVQIIFPNDFFALKNLPDFLTKNNKNEIKNEIFADVKIIGKVDFAETLSFLLHNLNIDFEADISNFIGDIPAHFLGEIIKKIFSINKTAV